MKPRYVTGLSFICVMLSVPALGAQTAAVLKQATGTPPGVAPMKGHNSSGFSVRLAQGQPVETRPPEKADDKPVFPGQTRAPYRATIPVKVTTITDGLDNPWSLAFLPDGKFLVTEKQGAMVIVTPQGSISKPLAGVPAVAAHGQMGLLDVALDPKFAQNHRIFFSFSEPAPGDKSNIAIARATLDEAGGTLRDVKVIFHAKPALPAAGLAANAGSRLAIGRDGTIFATIGDRSKSPPWLVAQQLDTDLGKVIHITPDGAPAPDNPFLNTKGALPEIWSYGHRSEEGLTIAPDGQLWETEHGPRGGDEINKIEKGRNYGWPVIVHGIDYPGGPIGAGITQKAGMEQPVYYWDPVIAPSGFAFYTGNLFPQWKDSVLVGGLRGEILDRLTLKNDRVVDEEPLLSDLQERIRDVRVAGDGAVYVLTDDSKLLKLTPK